jgi:hypothetical protein
MNVLCICTSICMIQINLTTCPPLQNSVRTLHQWMSSRVTFIKFSGSTRGRKFSDQLRNQLTRLSKRTHSLFGGREDASSYSIYLALGD